MGQYNKLLWHWRDKQIRVRCGRVCVPQFNLTLHFHMCSSSTSYSVWGLVSTRHLQTSVHSRLSLYSYSLLSCFPQLCLSLPTRCLPPGTAVCVLCESRYTEFLSICQSHNTWNIFFLHYLWTDNHPYWPSWSVQGQNRFLANRETYMTLLLIFRQWVTI